MDRRDRERLLVFERERRIRRAKKSLWEFCKMLAPDFYREGRWHLKLLCDTLQALYEGRLVKEDGSPYKKLMMNMPPRHGKSRTLINFCMWALGRDKSNKVITCSYNDDAASDFSRYTRDGIAQEKTYPHEIVYGDIFPESRIKKGNGSYQQWALEGEFFNYKGAGIGGSITGKGCNISIVDDPVKDAETALNARALDKIWTWYSGTFLSRKEEGAIEIINMTRWAKKDICGRILVGPEADDWYLLKLEAKDQEGKMLCSGLLSEKSYQSLKVNMVPEIFKANYHQEPIDQKGKLYSHFSTYNCLPANQEGKMIISYIDTADQGDDYLCAIAGLEYEGEIYIVDVLYTKAGMEVTEPQTAEFLVRNGVNKVKIESNNGGRSFARNVERILWEEYKTRRIDLQWFHQSKNKKARIISNSSFVMNHIYYSEDWKNRWPNYYEAMNSYQKSGKNRNDDGPDATTGLAEMVSEGFELMIGRV